MQKDDKGFSYYLYPILFATLLSSLVCAISLTLLSVLALNVDIPISYLPTVSTVLSGVAVFVGSFFMARKARRKGLFLGLSTGILFFTIMLLLSAATQPMGIGNECLFKFVASVLGGILGGVLGVNSKQNSMPI